MSVNYAALKAEIALPAYDGMSDAQIITAINAKTVTGQTPATFSVTGAQVQAAINYAEFAALTAARQSNVLQICLTSGNLTGGTGTFLQALFVAYFPAGGATLTALAALAKATVQPWALVNVGIPVISQPDLDQARAS